MSVPVNGGTAVRLNTSDAVDLFAISSNNFKVVYSADEDTAGQLELYSVSIFGGSPEKLNDPLVTGGNVSNLKITPDSQMVVSSADQDWNTRTELYNVPHRGRPSR
jgi:hypothetical protein